MTVANDPSSGAGSAQGTAGPRHFLDLDRLPGETLRDMLALAGRYKAGEAAPGGIRPAEGKTLALVFEKPSTRTRVSFEVGMAQMGGRVTVLNALETQLGRGETVADTARVLSRYVDAIMLRTVREANLLEMAEHAGVPVINGLTDRSHPCQVMADVMTFEEIKGPISGRLVAWVGDGNNVCASWIHGAARFGYRLRIASPKGFAPAAGLVARARADSGEIELVTAPDRAVAGADCVVTDTWLSMSNGADGGAERERRVRALAPYRVDEALMARAAADAIFMHCLPASREREVSAGVIDGPRSAVWDEAENRLHAQKGILHWCLAGAGA
ncbi:MAG TPA: ornithine carbamoyltransferase [Alphaproteobacteria bacterium]